MEIETKSKADSSLFKLDMDSLWVHDPNVLSEVERANKGITFTSDNRPDDYVLKTINNDEKKSRSARDVPQRNSNANFLGFS